MASRAETTRDQWVTAFATITTGNGYNTTLSGTGQVSKAWPPDEKVLVKFPHVSIELGESRVVFSDSSRTINDEFITLHIAGYVKVDTETSHVSTASKMMNAMEALVHDMKKKIASGLMTVNANHANNPWVTALDNNTLRFKRVPMLGLNRNIGMVMCDVVIKLKNQNSSFTAN